MISGSIICTALLFLASGSQALPTQSVDHAKSTTGHANAEAEPAWSVPVRELQQAIVCPQSQVKPNTVLIVPGTGEKASSFFPDNFGKLLTSNGYNVCYLDTPDMSIGDMQITGEYVAFAINSLARSTNDKIRLLSHSQGGTDIQWALTFWPSTREHVASFVALGPAWKGTKIGPFINNLRKAITGTAVTSVLQQSTGSNFLKALDKHSQGKMLVPTTSIWTSTDEIVFPADSGVMADPKSVNIKVQDICKARVTEHFLLVTDSVSQFFTLQAFKHVGRKEGTGDGLADPKDLTEDEKKKACDHVLPRFTSVKTGVSYTAQVLISTISTVVTGKGHNQVKEEPAIKSYAA